MTDRNPNQELSETELEDVQGGVGLLLPAVQSAREAARRSTPATEEISMNYEKIKFEY